MKTAIYIGRFQPFHNGHLAAAKTILKHADHVVFVIGSADCATSTKNPFDAETRMVMIEDAMFEANIPESDYSIEYVNDHPYNETEWITEVQRIAAEHNATHIGGFRKDGSSYYLDLFPNLEFIDTGVTNIKLSATDIRTALFEGKHELIKGAVAPLVFQTMLEAMEGNPQLYQRLIGDYLMLKKYKESWAAAPYPPTFVTADAVVLCAGHVLLVERGASPGKGLLALPGGFVEQGERLEDAAIRELMEETRINMTGFAIRRSIAATRVYDDPLRSERGRTITHAYGFRLEDARGLPQVKGADDAAKAFWKPLSELKPQDMFEDHYSIIQDMIGRMG